MSRPSWPLQKAIAEVCGIPTEGLVGMIFDDSNPEDVGTITTVHLVMPPVVDGDSFRTVTQIWTPTEVTDESLRE